jgi:Tfp pilus assembly protein PilX
VKGGLRLHRLRARLRCERGFALVLALGVMFVLSATGASVAYYATSNASSSARSSADKTALALAEAGLNIAYGTLFNAPDPRNGQAVPLGSTQMEGGTAEWWGTLAGSTWTLVGRGTVRNPAGPKALVRRRSGQVTIQTGQQGSANNAIWNYLYADSLASCTTLSNSVTIDIPLYVRGDLCMNNSAQVIGSHLQVGGTLTINNTAQVSSTVTEAHIGGGCRLGNGQLHSPCSASDHVYAAHTDASPTGLTKPPIDLANWYANADLGPHRNCSVGSFPGGFDNDAALNRSRGPVDLMPSTAYDCRVLDGQGNVIGQLTWTPGQGQAPGSLIAKGTIYFDGDITLSHNAFGVYSGRATIYSSGRVTFANSVKLCGTAACDGTWNANQNLLAFIAGSSTDSVGFLLANNTSFQGAVYAVNDYSQANSSDMWGPVIARQLFISNNTHNHYVPFGTLLPGMPATYEEVTVLAPLSGGFGE